MYWENAHTFIVSIGIRGDDSVVIVNALEHIDGHVVPPADEVAVTVDPYIVRSTILLPSAPTVVVVVAVVEDYSIPST